MMVDEVYEDICPDCGHEDNSLEEWYIENGLSYNYMACKKCGNRFIWITNEEE